MKTETKETLDRMLEQMTEEDVAEMVGVPQNGS